MARKKRNRLLKRRERGGFFALSATVWSVALVILVHVGLLDFLENRVVRALEFRVRAALGHSPEIDPHLKAYALDDSTAAMIGGVRLSTADWIALFRTLAQRHPRAIVVDGMFSSNQDVSPAQADEIRELAKLDAPLVVGALLTSGRIRYRSPLPSSLFQRAWEGERGGGERIRSLPGALAYGPTPLFQEAFRFVGHIVQPWPTRFAPAVRIDEHTLVPHLGLFASRHRTVTPTSVAADGVPVPLDADGLAPINFLPPDVLASQVKTLRNLLEKARTGQPAAIGPDDVVLIINNYSTGNTDVLDSPFGPVPGGYIILSVMNSVMRGDWLTKAGREEPYIVAFAAVGTLVGYLGSSFVFWILLLGLVAAHLCVSLATFTFGSVIVPWLFPLVAFAGCALTAFARQRYRESKRRLHLEMEVATASALQQNFFPPAECEHELFSLAAFYHPADAVGGDWYSYGIHGGRWLHLHLGDVTGHGTPAALLASFAKGATDMIYEDHAKSGKPNVSLEDLHANLNDLLSRGGDKKAFMTLLSLAVDLETGECRTLNSGHRPAIVLNSAKSLVSVVTRSGSSILGYKPSTGSARVKRYNLRGDELILILSDGLLDVPTARGRKINDRRLQQLLSELAPLPPAEIRSRLAMELGVDRAGAGAGPFIDDVTFVVVRLRLNEPLAVAG